ncbi:MAG TPA: hypothetical protein DIV86_06870 [Alphaproteobacteria bacterium]|nr:hypothetical protein [Alphaproteobacteria bacterium]
MTESNNKISTFLTEDQTCKLLSLNKSTLRRWRILKKNLPFVKMGRHVRYRYEDLKAFINNNIN